ncbi:hypothetical protein PGT21_004946 [Puccinia graminis f. sp. tritici]|uniref:RRM domain-containing protein n=1 Tax=Puccinia graminis f. sp. tritici TaxID=56615 RepID=A0A5B0PQR5_PUCGR|nr:hypothetical protein PGT21_004946 [Puccinia graminis f. sp. tritici]
MSFPQVLALLVTLFTLQEVHCTSIYSLIGLKDSSTQPLIKKETDKHFPTIFQLHSWLGIPDSSTYETQIKKVDHGLENSDYFAILEEPEIEQQELHTSIPPHDSWIAQTEFSTEPLLEKGGRWLSVFQILGKSNYSPTLEEQHLVKKKLSKIPQIQFKGKQLDKKVVGEIPTAEERKNLMKEDLKSLRESCLRLQSSSKSSYNGYLNPDEYSKLSNDQYRYEPIYKNLNELNQIHTLMEKRLLSLNAKRTLDLLPIGEYPKPDEEIGIICRQISEKLTSLLCKIEPSLSFMIDFHSLNVQRLICETIYYFHKHALISPESLGPLLTTREASQAFSKHIIWSFNHHQINSKNWIPLNGTNLIKSWFQFSCGNMFEEYYQYYPEEEKNPCLKDKLGRLQRRLFNKAPQKYHSSESGELEYYVINDDPQTIDELGTTFKHISLFIPSHSELAHLFQVIESFGTVREHDLEAYKRDKDFKIKFDLMDSSTQFLGRLENIRLYLQHKFNPNQWIRPIFDQPHCNQIRSDIGPLEELELIAKYLKIIQAEHQQTTGGISSFNPLNFSVYCQHEIIQKRLDHLNCMLINLASNF